MEYGYFSNEGKIFNITERDIPRNWYNYLWNDDYVAFISQAGIGEGLGQDFLGTRIELVKSRKVYISDGENFHTVDGIPVEDAVDGYECKHKLGASEIFLSKNGIESDYSIFVPKEGTLEVWTLKLKNVTDKVKNIDVTAYVATDLDGVYKKQGYNHPRGDFDKSLNGICHRAVKDFKGEIHPVFGYLSSSETVSGYDARHNTFIGTYGNEFYPRSLVRNRMENNTCDSEKACFALQSKITLHPGEEKEIVYVCGYESEYEKISENLRKYLTPEKANSAKEEVLKYFNDCTSDVTVNTPDENINNVTNNWLKYVTVLGSRWARVRHNGIRDLTQDTQCLSSFNPCLARERIKRIMQYQYANGYMPRTVIDGAIRDNNFSDNAVWLAMAVKDIVYETGDKEFLNEIIAFNNGETATVYEHVKRSVEFLYSFTGHYGLIKIWGGDWNDCMDRAGIKGKGVSVWLSIAWCLANDCYISMATLLGKTDDVEAARKNGASMRKIINEYGWDGEYYLVAYTDDEIKIGSHEDDEGKMFLLPQVWAIMADVADDERKKVIYNSVKKILDRPIGTLVSYPAYSYCRSYLGSAAVKSVGAQENGGVYLQPVCWKIIADTIMKDTEELLYDINSVFPFTNKEVNMRAEPYMLYNSYFSNEESYRYATSGQSWRTASGQWFVSSLIRNVFGLKAVMDGIELCPCIPVQWKNTSISKKFRNAVYNISYPCGGTKIKSITVNGEIFNGKILPYADNETYDVVVELC